MQINNHLRPAPLVTDASQHSVNGIREQFERLQRNAAELARPEGGDGFASGSRDRALVEQTEIVQAVRANARALEASNEAIGTIIDIKV